MRLYHFLSEENAWRDIDDRHLKIALLNDVNDPFELMPACQTSQDRRVIRDLKKMAHERFGMLCFSADRFNPVQWSHYADGHRGMCFGFDVPRRLVKKVIYVAERPKVDMRVLFKSQTSGEAEMDRWLWSKYEHWSYEREYRMIMTVDEQDRAPDGRWYQDFSPDLRLAEIIVGERSTVTRLDLQNRLGDLAQFIQLGKARLSFSAYKVVRQRDPRFWP